MGLAEDGGFSGRSGLVPLSQHHPRVDRTLLRRLREAPAEREFFIDNLLVRIH